MIIASTYLVLGVAVVVFAILAATAAQAKRASRTSKCRFCGNPTLRLSTPDHLLDPILARWRCLPHRCEVCYRRQYRFAAAPRS